MRILTLSNWKPALAMVIAVVTLSAGITVQSAPAEAKNGRNAALAAGILGGLLLGSVVANANEPRYRQPDYNDDYQQPQYYQRSQVYVDEPAYEQPRPRHVRRNRVVFVDGDGTQYYAPRCKIRTVISYDDEGNAYRNRVKRCH